MRFAASFAALLSLSVASFAMPPLPRKAPELTIADLAGNQTLLSSYRGKVVVIEFLATTCIHCQHATEMFIKLHKELGARGFQPIGIAAYDNSPQQVNAFVRQFAPTYPIGIANNDTVVNYMGFSLMDRVMVPQIVVIDRKGMIRAQSPPQGDPNLQDEGYLRNLIVSLLKESAPVRTTKR